MAEANDSEMSDATREGLKNVLEELESGTAVLSTPTGEERFGIPAMQSIPTEYTSHLGVGRFEATSEDGRSVKWSGGGAMYRDGDLSWTLVDGDDDLLAEWIDYDRQQVIENVRNALDA